MKYSVRSFGIRTSVQGKSYMPATHSTYSSILTSTMRNGKCEFEEYLDFPDDAGTVSQEKPARRESSLISEILC